MIFLRRGLGVNNLGLALGVVLTFYSSVTKGWKLKVIRFWWPSLDFGEVTGKEVVEVTGKEVVEDPLSLIEFFNSP